jgi:hypothetical protein
MVKIWLNIKSPYLQQRTIRIIPPRRMIQRKISMVNLSESLSIKRVSGRYKNYQSPDNAKHEDEQGESIYFCGRDLMLEATYHDLPENKNNHPVYNEGDFKALYLKIINRLLRSSITQETVSLWPVKRMMKIFPQRMSNAATPGESSWL